MNYSFPLGSFERIRATCINTKIDMNDSYITHPNGKIKITLNNTITFTIIEGDPIYSKKIIRDIAVLALDQPYYPVTMEEWDGECPLDTM